MAERAEPGLRGESAAQTSPLPPASQTRLTGPDPLLPEIFALNAKWRGEKPALVTEDEAVSWRALDAAANRIANALIADGSGRGEAVAIAMQNGREMVEALAGVMKAGAGSAPLNLTVTDAALLAMIADSGARTVIATPGEAERLDRAGLPADIRRIVAGETAPSPAWRRLSDWAGSQSSAPPSVAIAPDDPFNIIYSSGTTGQPKGILHTHQTRLDWARDLGLTLRYHSGARALATLGLYSNISWVMILACWLTGGTLHLARRFDAGEALARIEAETITHTAMAPIQFQRMLDHERAEHVDLTSLQAVMSCGSPLPADLKQRLFARLPGRVIELYGLTEGVITTLDPEDAGPGSGRLASVGLPMLGTDLKIIGADDVERPAGEAGEIVSRGRIVMPFYLNRPDATGDAVWRDPDGGVWLRTGDIGRLDEDGFLYIVDRKKDMILSGGQNIYPADIEAVLAGHPDVGAAAVIGIPEEAWGETPLAVIEPAPGAAPDGEAIKAWLNERVGKRQRVVRVECVDALPRNPNGKTLKRDLRARFAG